MDDYRSGAAEHGPEGRAQCRGRTGSELTDERARTPPQVACLDQRKESPHQLSSCAYRSRSGTHGFPWLAHFQGGDLPCGAGVALPGGAGLGVADRVAAWPCVIG